MTPFFLVLRRRRVVLRPVAFRADAAFFFDERALLRAEPALRAVLRGREREDLRVVDLLLAELRFRALDPRRADGRLREPPLLFPPRFDPPRDDFLAAAMIRAPSLKCPHRCQGQGYSNFRAQNLCCRRETAITSHGCLAAG
jgi:hypothetical protein